MERERGRPAIGPRVVVRLPESRIEELDRDAYGGWMERAQLLRLLINMGYQAIDDLAMQQKMSRAEVIRDLTSLA